MPQRRAPFGVAPWLYWEYRPVEQVRAHMSKGIRLDAGILMLSVSLSLSLA